MASPPYSQSYTSAISPPYPSNAQLPQSQKRRQSDMPTSAPAIKRRKASIMSMASTSSAHPLRQTSFPPENDGRTPAYSRSPSVDTMSLASASVPGGTKKKKQRKLKGKENDQGVRAKSGTANEGRSKRRQSRDHTVEESEDEGPGEETRILRTKDDKTADNKKRAMLTQHFDDEQFQRFETWRGAKLGDATVRRLVNQTLSQSVPPAVILAIKGAAKIFAGNLIEGARKVQTEWVAAKADAQMDVKIGLPSPPSEGSTSTLLAENIRRGPLLPDHLRESFRRQLLEADGGLVGQLGLWQAQQHSGVERFGVKTGGKRLFK